MSAEVTTPVVGPPAAPERRVTRVLETSVPMVAAGDAVSRWAADVLAATWGASVGGVPDGGPGDVPGDVPDDRIDALVVATAYAGAFESVAFWTAALAVGPALAAPGAFPYTLANAPAGRIATALGIRGPSTTLLGDHAHEQALEQAAATVADDLAAGRRTCVLVVRLDPAHPDDRTAYDEPARWLLEATLVTA